MADGNRRAGRIREVVTVRSMSGGEKTRCACSMSTLVFFPRSSLPPSGTISPHTQISHILVEAATMEIRVRPCAILDPSRRVDQ